MTDKHAIHDVPSQYFRATDERDGDAQARLFADSGRTNTTSPPTTSSGSMVPNPSVRQRSKPVSSGIPLSGALCHDVHKP